MNKKIEELLNRQIEREGYSSNLYLAMASWAENKGFPGVASWLYVQSDEERMHLLKFIKYVNERGGKAVIPEIKKPPIDYKNIKELFKEVLKHEKFITGSINEITSATFEEKDFNTYNFLQWFLAEQVEEEASVQTIIDKLNLISPDNFYEFDRDILQLRSKGVSTQQ